MQIHPPSWGGWFARHQAQCSRRCQRLASCRSRPSEFVPLRERETLLSGRPWITACQRRVAARACRAWRLQYARARLSARALVVVVVLAADVVVEPAMPESPTAAAAAVVKPANASSSPQASIERRKSFPLGRLHVGGRAGGKRR